MIFMKYKWKMGIDSVDIKMEYYKHFKNIYTKQGVSYFISKDHLLENIPSLIYDN